MHKMKSLNRIAMEYWCRVGDPKELDKWAENQLKNNEKPHPDVCELFNKTKEELEELILKIAEEQNGFVPVSEAGEKEAVDILIEISEKLIKKEITPNKFCYVVSLFDANFLGLRKTDENTLEYPNWLGDLWNNCDWCDESWTNSNSPHLIEEVNKMLKENSKG